METLLAIFILFLAILGAISFYNWGRDAVRALRSKPGHHRRDGGDGC